MLRIERLETVSPEYRELFGEYGQRSWDLIKDRLDILWKGSSGIWAIWDGDKFQCIIGIIPMTMLGNGSIVYFFLGQDIRMKKLAYFIRRAIPRMLRVYHTLTVQVALDFAPGMRFVDFFGFRSTGREYELEGLKVREFRLT